MNEIQSALIKFIFSVEKYQEKMALQEQQINEFIEKIEFAKISFNDFNYYFSYFSFSANYLDSDSLLRYARILYNADVICNTIEEEETLGMYMEKLMTYIAAKSEESR